MARFVSGKYRSVRRTRRNTYPWQTDRLKPEPPSIVDINQNILDDMLGKGKSENTVDDNFETVKLVWAAYKSAKTGVVIKLNEF